MADLVTNTDWPAKKPYNTVSTDLIAWTPAIRANDRFAHRRQILGEFRGFNQHPYYYWPTLSAGRSRLGRDRKSTRLNSSHVAISYAVFCLKKKNDHSTQLKLKHNNIQQW